ncbi:MAG: CBS domain-containing protein [Bacillota bacterium]
MTQKLLNLLSPEDLREARQLLGYPEGSVGRLMTPDYVAVRPNWTVEEAMQHIRKKGRDMETINVVYVTDKAWHLIGVVSLRQLVLAKPSDLVSSTMTTPAVSLSAFCRWRRSSKDRGQIQSFHLARDRLPTESWWA